MTGRVLVGEGGRVVVRDSALIKTDGCECCNVGEDCPPFDPFDNVTFDTFDALNVPLSDPRFLVVLDNLTLTGPSDAPWCLPEENGTTKGVSVSTGNMYHPVNAAGMIHNRVGNTSQQFPAWRIHATFTGGQTVPDPDCQGASNGTNRTDITTSLGAGNGISVSYRETKMRTCLTGSISHFASLNISSTAGSAVLSIPPMGAITELEIEYLIFGGQTKFYVNGVLFTDPDVESGPFFVCSHGVAGIVSTRS